MSARSIGSISNRLGLFTVKLWHIRPFLHRSYHLVDCDECGLVSTRYRESAEAWRVGQGHANLHQAAINAFLGLPWKAAQRSGVAAQEQDRAEKET